MADTDFYYGHGKGAIGTRNTTTGAPGVFDIPLLEIDELSLSVATEKVEHISKRLSIASKDLSIVKMISGSGKIVCSVSTPDILKLGMYGTKSAVTGGSRTAAAYATGLAVGDIVAHPSGATRLSSIVITSVAGTPTLGTHYEIWDAAAGLIKILDLTGITQPFSIAASEAAGTSVGFMTQRIFERCLVFSGINIADNDKPCIVNLHKIQIEPFKEWNLLSSGNEVNKYEFGFEMLKDTLRATDATLGQYGNYVESIG